MTPIIKTTYEIVLESDAFKKVKNIKYVELNSLIELIENIQESIKGRGVYGTPALEKLKQALENK